MRLLAISDYHGKTDALPLLANTLDELKPDSVVFTGDIVKGYARGDEWLAAEKEDREPKIGEEILAEEEEDLSFYNEFFSFFESKGIPLFAIPGNMDAPVERYSQHVVRKYLHSTIIHLVHDAVLEFQGCKFVGFGGQLVSSSAEAFFIRRYLEKEAIAAMQIRLEGEPSGKLIFLTHHPPVGNVGNDNGVHKGSQAVNQLIKMLKPTYAFCGHAHKARAIERINGTTVINPGALKDYYYALVDTTARIESLRKLDL